MHHKRRTVLAGLVLVALFGGCINQDESSDLTRSQRQQLLAKLNPANTPGKTATSEPPALPPEKFLTYVGGVPMLPKYKTKWELDIERMSKQAAALGLPYADAGDDYRNKNFDQFFITKAPTSTGFRAPAEFEPSQAYILAPKSKYTAAWKKLFVDIIKGAWGTVPVILVYNDAAHKLYWETELKANGYTTADLADTTKIVWWKHQTNAIWARDYGPVSIVSSGAAPKLSFVDFRYYHTRYYDDEVPTSLAKDWGINVFRPDLDFEGGNFQNTSDGLCMATKGVFGYNPQFSQSAIEDIFKKYLACKKFYFPEPIKGAIKHIDMFSKIGSDTAILVGEYTAAQDAANKAILDANAVAIGKLTNPSGKTMVVTRIAMPDNTGSSSSKTWRTYTNSTSLTDGTNKVVLVPTYSKYTTNETAALASYAKVFPGWKLVKIDSEIIIPGQGAIHCITMQIPKGAKSKMETDPKDLCGATKWECVKATCGNIPSQGCCDGEKLKYCNSGKLVATDCTSNPKCGWDSTKKWYDCGTSGGADTTGKYVKSCNVVTDAAVPDAPPADALSTACKGVTYQGCCDGGNVYYCESGTLKTINCTSNPKCGWQSSGNYYDCGTSGGTDPAGKYKKTCPFGDAGAPKLDGQVKKDLGIGACGKITFQGCCEGSTLKYCGSSGKIETNDCTSNPKCGWDTSGNYYNCGTSGSKDPSGKFPLNCPAGGDASVPDTMQQVDQAVTQDTATVDQAATTDTTAKTDGKADDGDDGCSCEVGRESRTSGWPLLLLGLAVGLVLVRRRRR